MLSLCCQSRRNNSSKSAWRKFGSFSVHLLLPHFGRTSGPHDKGGADVFSFSAALTEWFWLYPAHPEWFWLYPAHLERCVCVHGKAVGSQREHWWRKAESRRFRGTASFSGLWWPPERNTFVPFLLLAWDPATLADVIQTQTQSETQTDTVTATHRHKWISLVAGPALWCSPHLTPQGCPTAGSDPRSLP